MKRTNVIVNEDLLEKARRASGEKTYSATINKALEGVVRKHEFWEAYDEWEKLAHAEGVFEPGYLEELRPASRAAITKKKARLSANVKRAPRSKR
jgi:Arc/MetJ family transcription regulator